MTRELCINKLNELFDKLNIEKYEDLSKNIEASIYDYTVEQSKVKCIDENIDDKYFFRYKYNCVSYHLALNQGGLVPPGSLIPELLPDWPQTAGDSVRLSTVEVFFLTNCLQITLMKLCVCPFFYAVAYCSCCIPKKLRHNSPPAVYRAPFNRLEKKQS